MKEIPLTQDKVALVSDCDFEYLNQWKWFAQKQRSRYRVLHGTYEKGTGKKGINLMHRVVAERMGILAPQIDHIDLNPLNNQRENLREATPSQQGYNRGLQQNNTSGVKGVIYEKRTGRWVPRVKCDGKTHYAGSYTDKEEARRVVVALRRKLHGEFACDE